MPANAKTQAPTNLEVIWQEVEHQKRLTTDLASQLQRVRRFARIDELEVVTGKIEQETALITSMTTLSQAVTVLADVRRREVTPEIAGQEYWYQQKAIRSRQVARNLARYRYLSTLAQVRTDRCRCGKHQGIQFKDQEGNIIEENYCPQWWWVAMSRMSFDSGRHKEFHTKCPLEKWLKKYDLKALENRAAKP